MKFPSDILFEEFPNMFCQELDVGYQVFSSWHEFLLLCSKHLHVVERPLYVVSCTITEKCCFVDASNVIEIPWNELEAYI